MRYGGHSGRLLHRATDGSEAGAVCSLGRRVLIDCHVGSPMDVVPEGVQFGKAVHRVLMAHMQRFTFSATGALRWKRDLSEYAEWARALRVPLLTDRFQELQVRLLHAGHAIKKSSSSSSSWFKPHVMLFIFRIN